MGFNSPSKKKKSITTSCSYIPLSARKDKTTQKEYEKKKKRIEKENARKQICLTCKNECKTGICEIFKH